jgi:hypothetical protein
VDLIAVLLAAAFPLLCLAFLLWMARFEERLPDAVRRTVRQPDPPPILAIPIQRTVEPPLPGPVARRRASAPHDAGGPVGQASEGSLSVAVPVGGSTNR